jgi:UPF0755 protein
MSIRNIILTIFCLILIFIGLLLQAPHSFPSNKSSIHIAKGTSLSVIANDLVKKHYIKSPFTFIVFVKVISIGKGVQAGDYIFYEKENIIELVYRLITGDQGQTRIKITIPEGMNITDMAFIFLKNIPDFNAPRFVALAKKDEGYLYPDTYYFLENVSPEEIISIMKNNFNEKIKSLEDKITTFKKPLKDIIIMASLVEKEANSEQDRKIVAGILWKRLAEGMYLQVDPPFYYILNKTGNITYADLKIDSPYNTYKYKGLPIGPIDNPSIQAIEAVITPIESKNYFYLSGKDGKMYYAITYDGHLNNKNIYLK